MKSKGREKWADRWMRSDGQECKMMNEEQYGDSEHQNGHGKKTGEREVCCGNGGGMWNHVSHTSHCVRSPSNTVCMPSTSLSVCLHLSCSSSMLTLKASRLCVCMCEYVHCTLLHQTPKNTFAVFYYSQKQEKKSMQCCGDIGASVCSVRLWITRRTIMKINTAKCRKIKTKDA